MTLTEFLTARIDEDEDRAKRAAFGWGAEWFSVTDEAVDWSAVHAGRRWDMVGCEDGDVTDHIARHDPARVLAECEAKRRIVEDEHFDGRDGEYTAPFCSTCSDDEDLVYLPCPTLRILALPYADHPGYRDEWRP